MSLPKTSLRHGKSNKLAKILLRWHNWIRLPFSSITSAIGGETESIAEAILSPLRAQKTPPIQIPSNFSPKTGFQLKYKDHYSEKKPSKTRETENRTGIDPSRISHLRFETDGTATGCRNGNGVSFSPHPLDAHNRHICRPGYIRKESRTVPPSVPRTTKEKTKTNTKHEKKRTRHEQHTKNEQKTDKKREERTKNTCIKMDKKHKTQKIANGAKKRTKSERKANENRHKLSKEAMSP